MTVSNSMLTTGTRLGQFEVGPSLGTGGMGEVYQAHDTVLGRQVALKVLPATFARDPDRLTRFEREARLLASLNHPNIAAIYNFEQSGDRSVLVMELVPGETLAQRLKVSRPDLKEALALSRQIAEALESAHAKGVVHRDLKPANIKITPDGTVKVLDFGLAKALRDEGPESLSASLSPTIAGATSAGVILGTAAYMSPEQARGKTVDAQSDVWAFGCVLYEMLSGHKAFEGETITDTMAAIVRSEPDWQKLPADTPLPIRLLLQRCLQKDPKRRLHHIADARLEIEDAPAHAVNAGAETQLSARLQSRTLRAMPWTIAGASAIVALVAIVAPRPTRAPVSPIARLELNLPADVGLYTITGMPISISPDGKLLAFSGTQAASRGAYLRPLDQPDSKPVNGTDLAVAMFFSPDSSVLGVTSSDSTLKKVSLKDGLVTTVLRSIDYNSGAALGADGRTVFVRDRTLWELPASGGAPRRLTTLDAARRETSHQWPHLLPDGKTLLFSSYAAGNGDAPRIEALALSDGARRVVVERATLPLYTATGSLIFLRDGALLAMPFDPRTLQTSGSAIRVVDNVGLSGSGAPMAAVSATGTLVYAPFAATATRLVWASREGGETPITDGARNYALPRLSPDGRRIVVVNESNALWLQDMARHVFTRLTSGETNTGYPVWSPDGQRVYYRTVTGISWIQTDGSGRGGKIDGTSQQDLPSSIAPDGETLAFVRLAAEGGGDIYALSLRGDPKPRVVVRTAAYEGGPQFSPDGHWIAYASNESGQFQVYVRPYPGPDRKTQVSTEGGSYPLWSRKGNELFYRNGNKMMAVEVSTRSLEEDPILSAPKQLFDQKYQFVGNTIAPFDVSADGQRFIMIKEEASANRLNVVLNWFEELKQRVPTR